jgi:beta-barrel assembly-enhancing protease
MKKSFSVYLILFVFLNTIELNAQDFDNYQVLVSTGIIPKEYTTPSSLKYKKDIEKISDNTRRKEKNARKQFSLETNFVLDDLLQSGLVMFNDKATIYLNEVLAKLIKSDEKVRIYTLRSPHVNAFATGRGDIFVTLGLLAQMENEAQLAYILCHELTHVKENHSLDIFFEKEGINKDVTNRNVLNKSTFNDKVLSINHYSKELETEADEKGLMRFLTTKYSISSLKRVYDILKYSDSPFDDVAFKTDFLVAESDGFTFKNAYQLEKVEPISGENEDNESSKSTHPSLGSRRKKLLESIKSVSDEGRDNYLVSKEKFELIRKIARFELPSLYLKSNSFPDALYNAYLLLQENPNSIYLKKCIAKSMYYTSKLRNDNDYSYESTHGEVEGSSQQVHYLLENMPTKEMIIMSLRYVWALSDKMPKDTELKRMKSDLFIELAKHTTELGDFKTEPIQKELVTDLKKDTTSLVLTKLDKIKQVKPDESNSEYWQYAFIPFLKDSLFTLGFKEGQEEYKDREKDKEYFETKEGKKAWRKYLTDTRDKGLKLGIKKIVVINPFYLKIDRRKKNEMQYIASEEGESHLRQMIKETAEAAKIELNILDMNSLSPNQIDQFNDIRFINEWYAEQVSRFDLSTSPGSQQAVIDSIAKKYNTNYFLWTGTVSLVDRNSAAWSYVVLSIAAPYLLPFSVYNALKPTHEMLNYCILFDVKTGKRQVLNFDYYEKKDSDAMIKSHLYDAFLQIKTEKEPNPNSKKKNKKEDEETVDNEAEKEAKSTKKETKKTSKKRRGN